MLKLNSNLEDGPWMGVGKVAVGTKMSFLGMAEVMAEAVSGPSPYLEGELCGLPHWLSGSDLQACQSR